MKLTRRRGKVVAALILVAILDVEEGEMKIKRGKTRAWMKRRKERGYFETIFTAHSIKDSGGFREMMRILYDNFLYVLQSIEELISPKQILGGNTVIDAKARLALTLRYLATGETYKNSRA